MKVILLEDVKNLGKPGDTIEVKQGYFRNYLLPNKLAAEATPNNMKIAQKKKVEFAKKAAAEKQEAEIVGKELQKLEIKLLQKAGDKNQLFGSVTNHQIADFFKEKGFEIDKHKISIAEPIKYLGAYTFQVKLHPEVIIDLNINVEKED